jgi:F0F1-type ATP synthase beta subunit
LSQPFFAAEIFTRIQGIYVSLHDTISGFRQIVTGQLDIWSEGLLAYLTSFINKARHCL